MDTPLPPHKSGYIDNLRDDSEEDRTPVQQVNTEKRRMCTKKEVHNNSNNNSNHIKQ